MKIRTLIVLATVSLCLGAGGGLAQAQTVTCTPITSLPYTINGAGPYCLTGNLSFATNGFQGSTPAITVAHSGAVIDLNGYRIVYTGALTSWNPAITILAGNANVVVRNGLISSFMTAVETSSTGTIVEDMLLYDNGSTTGVGVDINDGADGAIVRRCYIRNSLTGIFNLGNAGRFYDNDIFGYDSFTSDGVLTTGTNVFVVNNRFNRLDEGVRYYAGGTGKYRDNLTSNVTTPYTGGTSAGNNN